MSDKVSVLIPTYNREKFIYTSLDSILKQTYSNLAIIIYDDGSTDDTCKIIKSIKDKRVRLIQAKENKGVAYARNQLLDECETEFACWHDSDDLSNIYRIQLQYEDMQRHGKHLIGCHWTKLRNLNDEKEWQKEPKITTWTKPAFATFMFPVDKTIRFKEVLKIGGEDWEWVKRMKKIYGYQIVLIHRMYYVRFHGDRIGVWKRKLRREVPKELLLSLSYKELINYYNKHHVK